MSTYNILDFDWTSKLVAAVDGSPENLTPLVQLKLHTDRSLEPLTFEFTMSELDKFLENLRTKAP